MESLQQEATSGKAGRGIRRRRILALVAGGAVIGIGAVVTLAVWNDSEFATGTFTAGDFDLQGSINGTTFTSSTTGPGKTLTFTLNPSTLSPGAVVYAPFSVQTATGTDYQAVVTLANAVSGAIGAQLTYSLYASPTFNDDCSAADPPVSAALVSSRAANAVGAVSAFTLTAAATPQPLCFVVTANPGLVQGTTGTVTWEFIGTSGTPL